MRKSDKSDAREEVSGPIDDDYLTYITKALGLKATEQLEDISEEEIQKKVKGMLNISEKNDAYAGLAEAVEKEYFIYDIGNYSIFKKSL